MPMLTKVELGQLSFNLNKTFYLQKVSKRIKYKYKYFRILKEERYCLMVEEINDKSFENETSEGVVLTDFWATWCGPCKMQSPVIDQLSQEMDDVKFTSVDVDQNQDLAKDLGIMAIPTLIIKKDGKIVDRLTGYTPKEKLEEILDQYAD